MPIKLVSERELETEYDYDRARSHGPDMWCDECGEWRTTNVALAKINGCHGRVLDCAECGETLGEVCE